jgi:hypothetical protein
LPFRHIVCQEYSALVWNVDQEYLPCPATPSLITLILRGVATLELGGMALDDNNFKYLAGPLSPGDTAALFRVCRFLETAEIVSLDMVPRGSNRVFSVNLVGEDAVAKAIYKPRSGETPLWDFPGGTLYKREYAAFLVSQALGWMIVPATVIRQGPLGIGSVQWFVNSRAGKTFKSRTAADEFKLKQVTAFDHLTNNADRKLGHFLEDQDGRLWVVDHGLTFNAFPKLRTVLWDFAGQPIPGKIVADIAALKIKLQPGQPLRNALGRLLDEREIEALLSRVGKIIRTPEFTYPESPWSVPWPLI